MTGWKVGEDIAVFARTPEWLLTKRGAQPISQTGATAETIARDVVLAAAGDFITLGTLQGLGTEQDYSTVEVRTLHDVVCEVLNAQKLGFEVVVDVKAKRFVFQVYSGAEKYVLLSKSNKTAYDMEYVSEMQDMVCNSGWYQRKFVDMGEWDAMDNSPSLSNGKEKNFFKYYKITSTRTRFDLNCVEGEYLYCNTADGVWKTTSERPQSEWFYKDNTEVAGAKKWDAVLSGTKTETEAAAEILQMVRKETLSAKAKDTEYGTDYNLGDIVAVHMECGSFRKVEKRRVKSVNIYNDVNDIGVEPILGGLEE